jgi:hypothetical protein
MYIRKIPRYEIIPLISREGRQKEEFRGLGWVWGVACLVVPFMGLPGLYGVQWVGGTRRTCYVDRANGVLGEICSPVAVGNRMEGRSRERRRCERCSTSLILCHILHFQASLPPPSMLFPRFFFSANKPKTERRRIAHIVNPRRNLGGIGNGLGRQVCRNGGCVAVSK